jgi:hypothetical protein
MGPFLQVLQNEKQVTHDVFPEDVFKKYPSLQLRHRGPDLQLAQN